MIHTLRAGALAFALAATSCSSPGTCDTRQDPANPTLLESEVLTGSLRFSEANDSQTLRLRATLSGVPQLSYLEDAGLPFALGLRYESEPFGGDRNTEMPRLSITSSKPSSTTPITTDRYPGAEAVQSSPALFEDCTVGSRPCESTLAVEIKRLDGAPFPPVEINWHATARAHVALCQTPNADPHLALEVETP